MIFSLTYKELKLRLTFKGQRRYYGTGYDASTGEWDQINSDKATDDLRKIKIEVSAIGKKAILCIEKIIPFSFKQFEKNYFDQSASDAYISQLKANILLRNAAPMTFASQSLGHSNVIATQKYFAGFELKKQDEYLKALTIF